MNWNPHALADLVTAAAATVTGAISPHRGASEQNDDHRHMAISRHIEEFLFSYPEQVQEVAAAARQVLKDMLPGIAEGLDESARLLRYSFGPGYKGLLFTLIMSQAGVKLGIVRGSELPDPKHLMTGAGKVHRHVQLRSPADVEKLGLRQLLKAAVAAWQKRNRAAAT